MILETQRLTLKPILESERTTLQMIFTDSSVRKYLFDDEILPLQHIDEMLKQSRKHFEEENFGLWFIRTNGESEIIGYVGLWYFCDEEQPQLIYAMLPKALKKGYATEAATRILEYCFDELGYEYLVAGCDRPNIESQKVAERLGMRKIEEKIVNGSYDVLIGADGARSAVRLAMLVATTQQPHLLNIERFEFEQKYVPLDYKSIYLPCSTETNLDFTRIHTWRNKEGIVVLLVPQRDKSLNSVVLFPRQNNQIPNLSTPDAVLQFFLHRMLTLY